MKYIIIIVSLVLCHSHTIAADRWSPKEHFNENEYEKILQTIPRPQLFKHHAPYGSLIVNIDHNKPGYKTGFRKGDFLYAINNK
ncbi:MAG: hypothetical protein HRU15_01220, partial [Planctomycetes bacterium]|nr:hypothetical protein [Planctomycetota bacterium]